MDISTEFMDENISKLIEEAKRCNNFIRIDMEDSSLTDATIDLYKRWKEQYDQIGPVFQAYLYRSEKDLQALKFINGFRTLSY